MPSKEELQMLQALPLEIKVMKTQQRIREWVQYYGENGVAVSFSGGKDSTVLLHLVRQLYPNIEAMFVDTGLEYPEIRQFVKTFNNVTILRPKMNFRQVIEKYGYPIISKVVSQHLEALKQEKIYAINLFNGKYSNNEIAYSYEKFIKYKCLKTLPFKISHKCCYFMKKIPLYMYEKTQGKKAILGTLADESILRTHAWLKQGCNAFNAKRQVSTPLAFWTEQDILHYIAQNNLPIASVYGEVIPDTDIIGQMAIDDSLVKLKCSGCQRTGCMFCLFGMHLEKGENRIQRLHKTHPKIYDYVLGGGEFNEKGLWIPNSKGLGFKFVMDEVNRVMSKEIYRY